MSDAFAGVGATFSRWDGSEFVAIAEVTSITGPSMTRDTIDVTSLDTSGGYREFIAGFRNPGTLSLTMNFTSAGYSQMKTDFEDDTAQEYQIVLPDPAETTLEFSGLVTELPLTVSVDDKVTMDVTIQISGQVDLGSGGSA